MKLELHIVEGKPERKGMVLSLSRICQSKKGKIPYICEDEAIEFRLKVPSKYVGASIEVYQHSIFATNIEYIDKNEIVEFIWTPKRGMYQEKLFFNYFGMSKLNVLLRNGLEKEVELVEFESIQIVSRFSSADKVEEMLNYLSTISSKDLYSTFSATQRSAGFEGDLVSPDYTIERIEHTINNLKLSFPLIFNRKITRLVPEQKLLPTSGNDELDDVSIGWLLENLSALKPEDNPDQSHLYYEGQHYRASTIRRSVLIESSDVYENQVIHGFLAWLLHEAQNLALRYETELNLTNQVDNIPDGYVSFFTKINKFKWQLLSNQRERLERLIDSIRQLQFPLEKYLPVSKLVTNIPIITPKIRSNYVYRNIFVEIIKWYERRDVDWSAYENLFSINNIPALFEVYCYFRVVEAVNCYFDSDLISNFESSELSYNFTDINGNEVELEREPKYWVPLHTSEQHAQGIVNSEGYTIRNKNSFHLRGQRGYLSHRRPDIVVQIKSPDDVIRLLILDAKYTSNEKAFIDYLPELTMKYVHGIHRPIQEKSVVKSLSILHPDSDEAQFVSFHHGDMDVFSDAAVEPSLQSVGLILGEERESDALIKLIARLLEVNGVHRAQFKTKEYQGNTA